MTDSINKFSIHRATSVQSSYLGVYEPIGISFDETDYDFVITPKFAHSPSLLASELWGSPRLAWVIMLFNPNTISDPITDLVAGLSIRVPTRERLLKYF